MGEKKWYTKVELWISGQSQGYFISTWGNAMDTISDGGESIEGEMYIITSVEMTQEEFDNLGEWEGW